MADIKWVAVDWGTSNVRAFGIDHQGNVAHQLSAQEGMGGLRSDQFEPVLLDLLTPWLRDGHQLDIFACGMVGARQGWIEADYLQVPSAPVSADRLTKAPTQDTRINVYILPGLAQAHPANVMRGEETQIAGLLFQFPDFKGYACLPGTHSKWAHIKQGCVQSFETFMTGELFALLSNHSVLRFTLAGSSFDQDYAVETARSLLAQKTKMTAELFSIRAQALLAEQAPHVPKSTLSGLLIGQEIATMKKHWQNAPIVLIGAPKLTSIYEQILRDHGADVKSICAADATVAGLTLVANNYEGT